MADPENLAPASTTTTATTDAPRGSGPDRLAQLRAGLSVEQHAKALAAQAQVAEMERKLAEMDARARELEAIAAKAENVSQAQQHELALLDRRHALEMEHTQQQWKLTDARQERDRQNAEAQREREATVAAEQFAEVCGRCETLSREVTSMRAEIATHGDRITMASMLVGGTAGLLFTAARVSAQSTPSRATKRRRRAKTQPSNAAWAGVGGVVTTLAPIALQHMARQTAELPAPTTASGWDEHLMSLIKEHCRLTARLAIMRNRKVSVPTVAVGAVGVALVGYAITG